MNMQNVTTKDNPLPTRNLAENGILEYRRNAAIPAGTIFPDYEGEVVEGLEHHTIENPLLFDFPCIIDKIEWHTNHKTVMKIWIEINTINGWRPITRIVDKDSSSAHIHTPENIVEVGTDMWNIIAYDNTGDATTNFFKFSLREPIEAPRGIRIYLKNDSTQGTAYSGGIVVRGRKL